MKYDRDLLWARRAGWWLALANLVIGVELLLEGNWPVAIAVFVWCSNVLYHQRTLRIVQLGRNANRMVRADMREMAEWFDRL